MKLRNIHTSALTGAILAALPCAAMAATSFTEDFSGNALPGNMTESGGTPTYTSSNATFGGDSRYYVHTNELDYATQDFVAEATVTLGNFNPNNVGFFGMGPGNGLAAGAPNYSIPAGPGVYFEIAPQAFANGFVRYNDVTAAGATSSGATLGQNNGGWGNGTVHRARMTWDSTTQIATLALDQGYTGLFSADFTQVFDGTTAGLDSTDNGFDATNSSIFFGGGNGTSWDDISVTVVPEPSSTALLGLIGLGLLRRRRR